MSGTVAGLLAEARLLLPGEEARFEAELLLAFALGRDRTWLYAHADDIVEQAHAERLHALCARRASGVPVAHIVGNRGFWTLQLEVSSDTLIPRPDTETLVEAALAVLPPGARCRVADLGSGSGAIALALASERPLAQVVATDASAAALEVARRNAAAHGLANVEFRHGDWLQPLAGERYLLIASNPPYLAAQDPHLARGDLRFEPLSALVSGSDGLPALRQIVGGAPAALEPGGWLLVEHGHEQGEAVRGLFEAAAFTEIRTLQDLEQRDRVTCGQMRN